MSKTVNNRRKPRQGAPKNNNKDEEIQLLRQLVSLQKLSAPPPKWMANPPQFRAVRWSAVAAQGETDFTVRQLLFAQCVATTSTSLTPLAYAVRLRKVQIWFTSPALGTNVSSEIEWTAAGTGFLLNQTSVSQTSSSTTEYSYLVSKPPRDSLAAWYQGGVSSLSNVLFSFSMPADAIIQIDFDWVPNYTEAIYTSNASSALVVGTLYCQQINANVLSLAPLNAA